MAGGMIAARYIWEPNPLIPDIRPFLPSDNLVLFTAGALVLLIFLYHFWYAQFFRVLEGLFIVLFGYLLGIATYIGFVSLFNYSEFISFEAFWQIVFHPQDEQVGISHMIGRALQAFVILVCLWEAAKAALGFGKSKIIGTGVFHQRGRRLISYSEAVKHAERLRSEDDYGLWWGMMKLPSSVATSHFAIVGSTGSGKTISIRLLMQSVLPNIGTGKDQRALIYDAKQDIVSILAGINPPCEVVILNPFDKRGVAWDMARDITSPATAQQIATILIPENKNASQPFFSDAARHLLSGVLISFIKKCPEKWTFRDVVLALKSQERLKKVLLSSPETSDLVEHYFSDETTARNVMSTVATKMQRYEFIAAAWERADKAISLREWLTGEFILVLGNDEATRTAVDAINQVIFKRLSELILAQTESETRRTWVFLDELRQAGKLEGLSSLLTKGRSKGASVVLGYQDIEGLREVYGHQLANEIAGQCANKAILRCDSSDTAKWAAALFGEREVLERREGTSQSSSSSKNDYSFGGSSTSGTSSQTSEQVLKREVVLPSEIMDIPPTTAKNGLSGYYLTPLIGAYFVTAEGDWIANDLRPKSLDILDIDPREESDQYLNAWGSSDFERLSLEAVPLMNSHQPKAPLEENPLFQVSRKDKIDTN
jgi:type IV secretory pathway TraG/TraD family ATPase VirD4